MAAIVRRSTRSLAALLAASLLLAACSDGDDEGGQPATTKAPDTTVPATGVALTLTGTEVQAASKAPPPFPESVQAAVMTSLNGYLANAMVAPLRSGKPPSGLETVFTGAALARLSGPDRPALVEDGTPVSGEVTPERASAKLTALAAPGGEVVLVTALLDVALVVASKDTRLAVVRTGEVVLVPAGGGWLIDSYDLRAQRDTQPKGQG